MERRPTLKDVAAHAGVHYTTVSLALSNHPSIPERTRIRIRASVAAVGYRPDPMLASLMKYRRSVQSRVDRPIVAWVTNFPVRNRWRKTPVFEAFFKGASDRADELGFKFEEFWLRESDMSVARANQILVARNINALLLAPQPQPGLKLDMDWPQFSAVTLGYSLAWPRLHLVSNHQFASMTILVRELTALGYQRIGLALPTGMDLRVNHGWLGGYLSEQAYFPAARRITPLLFETFSVSRFSAWLQRAKIDALISPTEEVWRSVKTLGYRVPGDLAFALPSLPTAEADRAGMDEQSEAIGRAAMDMLSGLWQRNERGVPAVPQRLLIEAVWRAGATAPPRT